MANSTASWDIVDLTTASDEDVDRDLKNVKVAMPWAQDAASRRLEQAMSLESARSAHSSGRVLLSGQDLAESNQQDSTPAGNATRAFLQPKIQSVGSRIANQINRSTSRNLLSHSASSDLVQPSSVALDSGLGESVSGTEDARSESRSLGNTTSPPLKPVTAPVPDDTEGTTALQSTRSEQYSFAELPKMHDCISSYQAQHVASTPKKRGRLPKASSETRTCRKRTQDGIDDVSVFGDSKKRRITEGNVLDTSLAVKDVRSQSPFRRSLGDISSLYCNDDVTITDVLKEVIYPILKTAIEDRKGLLSKDKLIDIAKTVSSVGV